MKYEVDSYHVTISRGLEKYIDEFVTKAKFYGVDTKGISFLDKSLYMDLGMIDAGPYAEAYGITNTIHPQPHVIINSKAVNLVDAAFVRLVVFHELGHAVGIQHVRRYGEPHLMRAGAFIDIEYLLHNFDKEAEKEFFEYLKQQQIKIKK